MFMCSKGVNTGREQRYHLQEQGGEVWQQGNAVRACRLSSESRVKPAVRKGSTRPWAKGYAVRLGRGQMQTSKTVSKGC